MKPFNFVYHAFSFYVVCMSVFLNSNAYSASFDCKKASTLVEKTICKYPKLSELDEQLARQYKKELATSPNWAKEKQKQWLKYQRNTCISKECIGQAYQRRLKKEITYHLPYDGENNKNTKMPKTAYGDFLKTHQVNVAGSEAPQEVAFFVDIHPIPSKPHIAILDVQLTFANYHVCTIEEATVYWQENHWSFAGMQFNDGVDCNLRVYPKNGKLLLVDEQNLCKRDLCGARGYFDGIVLPSHGDVQKK